MDDTVTVRRDALCPLCLTRADRKAAEERLQGEIVYWWRDGRHRRGVC